MMIKSISPKSILEELKKKLKNLKITGQ